MTFRVLGLRMMPVLNLARINGAGTATYPGIDISVFTARGTNVGILNLVSQNSSLYTTDAFTNATGWNADGFSAQEIPSRQEIDSAWQPQVPALIGYVLYKRAFSSKVRAINNFSHNEIRMTTNKGSFQAMVLTDPDIAGRYDVKYFHRQLSDKFDNDDLLLYRNGHFYEIYSSGKVETTPKQFPDNILCANTFKNQQMKDVLHEKYDDYIQNIANKYYDPLLQGDMMRELLVAKKYSDDNRLLAIYCEDVMSKLKAMNCEDPVKYPLINFDRKLDVFGEDEPKIVHQDVLKNAPTTSPNPESCDRIQQRIYDGREWTNS